MTSDDLERFKEWFSKFTRKHFSENEEDQKNIALKVEHTFGVCRFCRMVAEGEGLDADKLYLFEAAALFHDVGRFPQYAKYKTFRDAVSVNHGRLGAEVLIAEDVLAGLTANERTALLNAVKFHNSYALPDLKDAESELLLRLVRDADKLDIWRVFMEYYEGSRSASQLDFGVPDVPGYSDEIISLIAQGKTVSLSAVKTMNDIKLLQLSWVYDLNFPSSYRLFIELDYLRKFGEILPQDARIASLISGVKSFTEAKASGGQTPC